MLRLLLVQAISRSSLVWELPVSSARWKRKSTLTGFPCLYGLGETAPHHALPFKQCNNTGSSCTGQRVCLLAAFSLAGVCRRAVSEPYSRMWIALQEG